MRADDKRQTAVGNTVTLLSHFRAFLASDCQEMRDPMECGYWDIRLDKTTAQRKLTWLVNVALNRRAGISDCPSRKHDIDYQRHLRLDAQMANRPQPIIRRFSTPELNIRLAHLLYAENCDER